MFWLALIAEVSPQVCPSSRGLFPITAPAAAGEWSGHGANPYMGMQI